MDRRARAEFPRDGFPLAAGAQDVQNPVEHLPKRDHRPPPRARGLFGWQQRPTGGPQVVRHAPEGALGRGIIVTRHAPSPLQEEAAQIPCRFSDRHLACDLTPVGRLDVPPSRNPRRPTRPRSPGDVAVESFGRLVRSRVSPKHAKTLPAVIATFASEPAPSRGRPPCWSRSVSHGLNRKLSAYPRNRQRR